METVSYFYSYILYFLVLELISQENTDDRVRFPAIDLFFKKSIHPEERNQPYCTWNVCLFNQKLKSIYFGFMVWCQARLNLPFDNTAYESIRL